MDYSKELALFLEKIRFQRGISQEDFTDGIISNRQYQRYVRGESPMPFHLLNDFAIKLNLKKEDLILEFQNRSINETSKIIKYFSAVTTKNLDQLSQVKDNISRDFIIENENLKLYDHTVLLEAYLFNKISIVELEDKLFKICNYPEILNRVPISLVDAVILSSIVTYTNTNHKELISNKIIELIKNPSYTFTTYQTTIYNILFFSLAKYYGKHKNYKSCVEICSLALSFNQRKESIMNTLEYYYFMTLSYFRLKNMDEFKHSLVKCYHALNIGIPEDKRLYYEELIKKDFNLNLDEFIIDYLNKKA